VAQAEAIVDAGVQSFMRWIDQRAHVPLIQQLNQQTEAWRGAEIARAKKMLSRGEDVGSVLEALSKGLTQKMLHGAYQQLQAGDAQERSDTSAAIERLFLRSKGSAPQPASHANEADPEQ
jgi:glutamyl-tRNA reductase